MPSQHGDANYWRTAAGNARTLAETFDDKEARRAMAEVASKLETIARRTYAQETGLNVVEGGGWKKAG